MRFIARAAVTMPAGFGVSRFGATQLRPSNITRHSSIQRVSFSYTHLQQG
jgi:hypothetical protein